MQNQILYYYANSAELNYIQNASSILPTNYFIGSICWLTFNSQWEKYVSNVSDNGGEYIAGIDFERVAVKDTLFRIQIDPHVAAHDFRDICINNHRSVKRAVKYLASIDIYNPNQWRFSFKPIPSIHWLGIDYWNNSISQWRPCPDFDPSESMIYLKDYQEVLNNLTVKMTRLESERDKAKAEVLDIKALADSKNIRIASLESSNGKLQQEAEDFKQQFQSYLETHTESALEQKNKQIEIYFLSVYLIF